MLQIEPLSTIALTSLITAAVTQDITRMQMDLAAVVRTYHEFIFSYLML